MDNELVSGTVYEWYKNAIDSTFKCNSCDEEFSISDSNLQFKKVDDPPSGRIFDKLKKGDDYPYNAGDGIKGNGLFTDEKALVQATIECQVCDKVYGHYYDWVRSQIEIPEHELREKYI